MRPSIEVYFELPIHLFDDSFNGIDATVGQGREGIQLLNHPLKSVNGQCGYDLGFAYLVAHNLALSFGVVPTSIKFCGGFNPQGSDHLSQTAVVVFESIDPVDQCVPMVLLAEAPRAVRKLIARSRLRILFLPGCGPGLKFVLP